MKTISFFVLILMILFSCKPNNNNNNNNKLSPFENILERSNLTLQKSADFTEVKPIENSQMMYDYAIKHTNKKFEIRYAIRPLDSLLLQHQQVEKNKKPGDVNISPNKWYETSLQAIILNISNGSLPDISEFDSNAVKSEFNADWGASTLVEPSQEFGQGYKYCIIVALHKDDNADAYIFYLSDSKNELQETIEPYFHSLKFKEK